VRADQAGWPMVSPWSEPRVRALGQSPWKARTTREPHESNPMPMVCMPLHGRGSQQPSSPMVVPVPVARQRLTAAQQTPMVVPVPKVVATVVAMDAAVADESSGRR